MHAKQALYQLTLVIYSQSTDWYVAKRIAGSNGDGWTCLALVSAKEQFSNMVVPLYTIRSSNYCTSSRALALTYSYSGEYVIKPDSNFKLHF